MPFEWRLRDKYASKSPERFWCLNSVRLVLTLPFQDIDLIRHLVSRMYLTELFDLHVPPIDLPEKDLVILVYYILDPQRQGVSLQKADRFLVSRFFSTAVSR